MKKILSIILVLVGLGLAAYAVFTPWTGKEFKMAGQFITKPGVDYIWGKVLLGLAALTLVLTFVRPQIAVLTGLLVAISAALVYFMPTEGHTPQSGIYMAIGGGLLATLGAAIAPRR